MATFGSYRQQAPVNGTPPNAGMTPTNQSLQGAFNGNFGERFANIKDNWAARFPGFADRMKNNPWMQNNPGLQGFMNRLQPQPGVPEIPPQQPGQPVMAQPQAPALDVSQLPNGTGGLASRRPGWIPPQPGPGGGYGKPQGQPSIRTTPLA